MKNRQSEGLIVLWHLAAQIKWQEKASFFLNIKKFSTEHQKSTKHGKSEIKFHLYVALKDKKTEFLLSGAVRIWFFTSCSAKTMNLLY